MVNNPVHTDILSLNSPSILIVKYLLIKIKIKLQMSTEAAVIRIDPSRLEGKLKSKKDLYDLLSDHCKCRH